MVESGVARALSRAESACRKTGVRLTSKRRRVLTILLESEVPLSAYDVAEHYRSQFDEIIPPMSVYRMLDVLVDKNLVHKLVSSNKYMACSHIVCDHRHETPQFLICDSCQRVDEIAVSNDTIRALQDSLAAADFQLASPQLELHGVCGDCRSSRHGGLQRD
ncbi:MAG: transcriptional repressor [Bacteroidales bacterium]|nr:transcriptional repressor [Bacteroidales bacterium]